MAYALTHQERACLEIITAAIEATGIAPSFDELKTGLGLKSKSGIHRLMTALERRGHIHRLKHSSRAIALGPRPRSAQCPHCHRPIEQGAT